MNSGSLLKIFRLMSTLSCHELLKRICFLFCLFCCEVRNVVDCSIMIKKILRLRKSYMNRSMLFKPNSFKLIILDEYDHNNSNNESRCMKTKVLELKCVFGVNIDIPN